MQGYPEYGYKQESYVILEEEKFVKGNSVYDNSSSMQMMRPNEYPPTPPHHHHHHAPSYHDGYYEGTKHGKEGYWPNNKEQHHHSDSWNMDKPSYACKRRDGDYKNEKYENSGNMHHLNMGGGHHHAPPHMPPVVQNGQVKRYGDAREGVHRPYYYEHKEDVQCWSKGIDD